MFGRLGFKLGTGSGVQKSKRLRKAISPTVPAVRMEAIVPVPRRIRWSSRVDAGLSARAG